MKQGTEYAKTLKRFVASLSESPKVADREPTDPLDELMLGLLSWNAPREAATKALARLKEDMADLNEVRVSSIGEITNVIREGVPDAGDCARNISRALGAIYYLEHFVTLECLRAKGRREARQYLDALDGVNAYAAASVMLWSLGAHAIPVNQPALEALRAEGVIEPHADPHEVQGFLERHIAATDGPQICLLLERYGNQKQGRTPATTAKSKKTSNDADKKKDKRESSSKKTAKS